jgi:hypothetical protein
VCYFVLFINVLDEQGDIPRTCNFIDAAVIDPVVTEGHPEYRILLCHESRFHEHIDRSNAITHSHKKVSSWYGY